MILSTSVAQEHLKNILRQKAKILKNADSLGKLVSIVIGENSEQDSYVKIKKRVGQEVGIVVEKLSIPITITQSEMIERIQSLANDDDISGVIIQQPIPRHLDPQALYEAMPQNIEIEGHKKGSAYIFPLVQACMIGLWLAHEHEKCKGDSFSVEELNIPFECDESLLSWLRSKNIAIAGNGPTTGWQIAKYFSSIGIDFNQTNSKTENPDEIYRNADIIITGVGKEIINDQNIKRGTILLNFGLRNVEREQDGIKKIRLSGDYDEEKIKNIANIYTKTPGGLGPIDVLCLLGNLLESASNYR